MILLALLLQGPLTAFLAVAVWERGRYRRWPWEMERVARTALDAKATFDAEAPCPSCHRSTVIGAMLYDEFGKHQHTHYWCTAWLRGDTSPGLPSGHMCGWHGWSVP